MLSDHGPMQGRIWGGRRNILQHRTSHNNDVTPGMMTLSGVTLKYQGQPPTGLLNIVHMIHCSPRPPHTTQRC
jgi:hypothetical protein